MIGLDKLTADELLRWLPPAGKTRPAIVTNDLAWAEIRRRLERLEEIEANEQLAEDTFKEMRERLEKYEAALQTAYGFLGRLSNLPRNTNWAGEKWNTTLPEEMKTEAWTIMLSIADAAHAAVEGK